MRVVVVSESGGPEVLRLEDRADPSPGPGEVLVDVAAAGVNFMDIYAREGTVSACPPFAGLVAALPSGKSADGDHFAADAD